MRSISIYFIIFISIGLFACSEINLGTIAESYEQIKTESTGSDGSGLTNDEVINGLKEALSKGTSNSSSLASKLDGYYKNPNIMIPFPEEALKVKEYAEKFGLNNQVDKFVMTLNRAAEDAAKDAAPIFLNAIKTMSISEGFAILKGENNAATEYLKGKTSSDLFNKFKPVVQNSIEKVELTKYWQPLVSKYNKTTTISGKPKVNENLDNYVTQKAIDGLFFLITEEEKEIRANPTARVTDLLKKVFGSLD